LTSGADIEAPGAVIADGTPLSDARAFGQWRAAHRLVERGARTTIDDAATLGLQDRLAGYFAGTAPAPDEVSRAFWGACHGGQRRCAEYLLERGADPNWIPPWEPLTPLDAAARSGADELVGWLRTQGARSATGSGRPVDDGDSGLSGPWRRFTTAAASGPQISAEPRCRNAVRMPARRSYQITRRRFASNEASDRSAFQRLPDTVPPGRPPPAGHPVAGRRVTTCHRCETCA
jgi:hypothetical protein